MQIKLVTFCVLLAVATTSSVRAENLVERDESQRSSSGGGSLMDVFGFFKKATPNIGGGSKPDGCEVQINAAGNPVKPEGCP